jgi:hypothetical protein
MKKFRFLCLLAIAICSNALAQPLPSTTGDDIRQYILKNNSTLSEATDALNSSYMEAARLLGFPEGLGPGPYSGILGFNFATCADVFINPRGSARELLNTNAVGQFFQLRVKNDLSTLQECKGTFEEIDLLIFLKVWTVGKSQPIPYYVELKASIVSPKVNAEYRSPYSNSVLGKATSNQLEDVVEEAIEELVQDMGIQYLRSIGEW